MYNCYSRISFMSLFCFVGARFYQQLGSWCEKVTKKEGSDHISHISPPLFRPTLWHTRPITGWVANSWVSPLTNVANNVRAVKGEPCWKGLHFRSSLGSFWFVQVARLGHLTRKTWRKMFVNLISGPGPIVHVHVVGYSFGQYSWLMREGWRFAQLVHFLGSTVFDMT